MGAIGPDSIESSGTCNDILDSLPKVSFVVKNRAIKVSIRGSGGSFEEQLYNQLLQWSTAGRRTTGTK